MINSELPLWPVLLANMHRSIPALREDGRKGSAEIANLIQGALMMLESRDRDSAIEELVHCLGSIAIVRKEQGTEDDEEPVETARFFMRIVDAYEEWQGERREMAISDLQSA